MRTHIHPHIVHRVAAIGLLMLFVGYYVDVHFFAHAHKLNGVTIVHSHMHNSHHGDTESGGHTLADIALISCLSGQFLSTGETVSVQPDVYRTVCRTLCCTLSTFVRSAHLCGLSLRAPPELAD